MFFFVLVNRYLWVWAELPHCLLTDAERLNIDKPPSSQLILHVIANELTEFHAEHPSEVAYKVGVVEHSLIKMFPVGGPYCHSFLILCGGSHQKLLILRNVLVLGIKIMHVGQNEGLTFANYAIGRAADERPRATAFNETLKND